MAKTCTFEQTLCWKCENALGTCSWAEDFTPVKGWDARPTKIKSARLPDGEIALVDSFQVISCPEFVPDKPRKPLRSI